MPLKFINHYNLISLEHVSMNKDDIELSNSLSLFVDSCLLINYISGNSSGENEELVHSASDREELE